MSNFWRPLFSGDEAVQALSVAEEIALEISRGVRNVGKAGEDSTLLWQSTLDEGRPGQCILQAYLGLHTANSYFCDTAIWLLDQATDAAATLRLNVTLYFGFPGIAWVTSHLAGRLFDEGEESGLAEIDQILLHTLTQSSWRNRYDLLSGLVGLGVYALERLPSSWAILVLEAIVAQLETCAEHTSE